MNTLKVFSEKEIEYSRYQSRLDALRVHRSFERGLQQAEEKLEHAEKERQQMEEKLERAEEERQRTVEENNRLKKLLEHLQVNSS